LTDRQSNPYTRPLDPSASPRALYGAELRYYRERKGLSQKALARLLFVTPSFVANLETGRRRVHPDMAAQIDRVLETNGFFVRNLAAGRGPGAPEKLPPMQELEERALTVRDWDAHMVPGLLQAPAYAHALARQHDAMRIQARLDAGAEAGQPGATRARTLEGRVHPARYDVVLGETAIRRPVGTTEVMAEQLRHLLALTEDARIALRILPLSAEPPSALGSVLRVMALPDGNSAVHVESHQAATLTADPAVLGFASLSYDLLQAVALPSGASVSFLEAALLNYEQPSKHQDNGARPHR